MKRIGLFVGLMCALAGAPATATAEATYSFVALDSVTVSSTNALTFAGILEGAASPSQLPVMFLSADYLSACQRMALLAISRPGEYVLRLTWPGTSAAASIMPKCGLARAVP